MEKSKVKKGAWSKEEDALLRNCVEKHGEGKWYQVPLRAGLNRCKKSCRLRWMNYLRPNIKKGYFENDEIDLILRLHKLLGNRWSLIAGRLPGRTANNVKNFWNTHVVKSARKNLQRSTLSVKNNIIRPQPRTMTISKLQVPPCLNQVSKTDDDDDENVKKKDPCSSSKFDVENLNKKQPSQGEADECFQWWRNLFELSENEEALICGHANNLKIKDGFNTLSVDRHSLEQSQYFEDLFLVQ